MRRIYLLLIFIICLFFTYDFHAQVIVGNYGIQYVTSAPSGTCSTGSVMQVVTGTGSVYTCQSGTWAIVGGGGGAPTTCATTTDLLKGSGSAGGCIDSGIAPANVPLLNTANTYTATQTAPNITATTGFYIPEGANSNQGFCANDADTCLQAFGGNFLLRVTGNSYQYWTAVDTQLAVGYPLTWGPTAPFANNPDTGLSRDSADAVDCGNGTQGDKTCTFNAGAINIGGIRVIAPISSAITSATGGTGISAVTCSTASCTNLRGTYTMTATAVSAGTILTLVWPTTSTAYACQVVQNGGSLALGLGHSVATATGMTISNAVSAPLTGSIVLDYECQP